MWFIGAEVEQETSAPPPKKILDPTLVSKPLLILRKKEFAIFLSFDIQTTILLPFWPGSPLAPSWPIGPSDPFSPWSPSSPGAPGKP